MGFPSETSFVRLHEFCVSIFLLILLGGCQSADLGQAAGAFKNSLATEDGRARYASQASALTNEPVFSCSAHIRVAGPAIVESEFHRMHAHLFPISGHSRISDPFDSRYPDEEEIRLAEILVDRFVQCMAEKSERLRPVRSVLQEKHLLARRKLLPGFLEGEISFGTYTTHIQMLDSQLRARVFYYPINSGVWAKKEGSAANTKS